MRLQRSIRRRSSLTRHRRFFNETPPVSAPSNPPTTFVDGYSASVGTIRLPALTTEVRGTLRASATGNVIGNESMSLDFSDIAIDSQATDNAGNTIPAEGTTVSYSVPLITTTTDADGRFVFNNVPDDSCFVLRTVNFVNLGFQTGNPTNTNFCDNPNDGGSPVDLRGVLISTTSESNNTVELAGLTATDDVDNDQVGPYVSFVSDVPVLNTGASPGNDGNRGTLSNGVDGTGGIVIRFSEPVATNLNDSDLIVVTGDAPNQTAVGADLTVTGANEVTVTLDSALDPGTEFNVYIRTQALLDSAGNQPRDDSPGGPNGNEPTFDDAGVMFASASQLGVFLETFEPTNTVADAVMLEQRNEQVDTGDPADQFPFQTTSTLVDTVDDSLLNNAVSSTGAVETPGAQGEFNDEIQNLNAVNLPDPNEDFFTDILHGILFGDFDFTHGDVARVTVTLPTENPPMDVVMSVRRNSTLRDVLIFPVEGPNGSAINAGRLGTTAPDTNRFIIDPNGLTSFDVVIIGRNAERVQPSDVLIATSRADAGLLGGEAMLTLEDNAPPTVTPQLLAQQIDPSLAVTTGTGGGVVSGGSGDRHLFVFPVSPQALDNQDPNGNYNNDTLQDELGSTNFDEASERGARTIPGVTNGLSVFHDATSTAAFIAEPARTLGVSVTEPLAAPPLLATPAYSGGASLVDFTSQNNVALEGTLGGVDRTHLVIFGAENVFNLEADGRGTEESILDLTDTIEDQNGVVADMAANARALVRDNKPPVMTFAFYDGQQVVFRFDEPVRLQGQIEFLDCGAPTAINLANAATDPTDPAVLSMGNTQITIPTDNPAVPNVSGCFGDADLEYAEDAYSAANLAGLTNLPMGAIDDTPGHGAVSYNTVPDRAAGTVFGTAFPDNTWDDWASNGLGMDAPIFAMADVVGPFAITSVVRGSNYSTVAPGPGVAGDTFNIDITFSQPFFVTDGDAVDTRDDVNGADADEDGPGNNDGTVTQAELVAWAAGKFEHFDATAAAANPPTDVQILDSNGQDITTVSGDNQAAQRIILTFTQANPIVAGDQVRIVSGSQLEAQFDATSNTLVFAFDEGTGQPAGSHGPADGNNEPNELAPIPPAPTTYTCPQAGPVGMAGEC